MKVLLWRKEGNKGEATRNWAGAQTCPCGRCEDSYVMTNREPTGCPTSWITELKAQERRNISFRNDFLWNRTSNFLKVSCVTRLHVLVEQELLWETGPNATFSTTNHMWLILGSNSADRNGKKATNRLSYGTACKEKIVRSRNRATAGSDGTSTAQYILFLVHFTLTSFCEL
jgi:hypothetical protein